MKKTTSNIQSFALVMTSQWLGVSPPLTWSLGEHLAVFSRRSQASTVEGTDLDEVVRVWQHVLQAGLVDRGLNEYTVRSRLWVIILSPVLDLVWKSN